MWNSKFKPAYVAGFALLSACANPTDDDAASDGELVQSRTVYQRGQVIDEATKLPVPGAHVSALGTTVISDADGRYALPVPRDTPYIMEVTAQGFWKLIDHEIKLRKSAERLVPLGSDRAWFWGDLWANPWTFGRDPSLGVLAVSAWSLGKCLAGTDDRIAKADGATFELHGDPDVDLSRVRLVYFDPTGHPNIWRRSARTGALTHAVFFNVPVGVELTVEMHDAPCKQVAYPVEWHGMIFTRGEIATEPGKSWSFTRVFME